MASLTLKNIPDELLERIKERAERERRSMTQQVLYMLEKALDDEHDLVEQGAEDQDSTDSRKG